MKKLLLELDGESDRLVFDDAEVDAVVPAIVAAITIISGQQCTVERPVLVHASCYEVIEAADEVVLRGTHGERADERRLPHAYADRSLRHACPLRAGGDFRPAAGAGALRGQSRGRAARQPHRVWPLGQCVDTGYPLSMPVARALRNGTVCINNDHNPCFAGLETGGDRRSGLGRLHGYDALIDFQAIKHIYQHVGAN